MLQNADLAVETKGHHQLEPEIMQEDQTNRDQAELNMINHREARQRLQMLKLLIQLKLVSEPNLQAPEIFHQPVVAEVNRAIIKPLLAVDSLLTANWLMQLLFVANICNSIMIWNKL